VSPSLRRPDPCDNRIIHCHNALQFLSCICELAACLSGDEVQSMPIHTMCHAFTPPVMLLQPPLAVQSVCLLPHPRVPESSHVLMHAPNLAPSLHLISQDLHEAAHCIRTIADCAYYVILGCMVAQVPLWRRAV
jgi:hypothetical protein